MREATRNTFIVLGSALLTSGLAVVAGKDIGVVLVIWGTALILTALVMSVADLRRRQRRLVARVQTSGPVTLWAGGQPSDVIDAWFFNEEPSLIARDVTAEIVVFRQHQRGGKPVASAMGKWRQNTEPEQFGMYHPTTDMREVYSSVTDIAPNNIPGKLVVVARERCPGPAYLFTNLQDPRHPDQCVPDGGAYRVRITVRGVDIKRLFNFELWNAGACFLMFAV